MIREILSHNFRPMRCWSILQFCKFALEGTKVWGGEKELYHTKHLDRLFAQVLTGSH